MLVPEISALITMFVAFSPFFTAVFLVMHSFFNNNLQGVTYLSFLIITQIIGYLMRPLLGGVRPDIVALESGQTFFSKHRACNIVEDPWFSKYSSPSFHAIHHSFTLVYVFMYELANFKQPSNIILFIFFFLIYVGDFVFRITNNCVKWTHYLAGTVVGVLFGLLFYNLVNLFDPNLNFNSKVANPQKCKINSSKMQCKMEVWTYDTDTGKYEKEGDSALGSMKWDDWLTAFRNGSINGAESAEMSNPIPHTHQISVPSHSHNSNHKHNTEGNRVDATDETKAKSNTDDYVEQSLTSSAAVKTP